MYLDYGTAAASGTQLNDTEVTTPKTWVNEPDPNPVHSSHWTTKENRQKIRSFHIFRWMQKIDLKWPQRGSEWFFPTTPDLHNILGRTDFDFESFHFLSFLGYQISRFPNPGPRLGRAWEAFNLFPVIHFFQAQHLKKRVLVELGSGLAQSRLL